MVNRILLGVLVALVLGLAGTGYALRSSMKHNSALTIELGSAKEALKTSKRLRAADASALKQSRAAQAALAKQKAAQDEALQSALDANPDWAAQRVPDAVVDALGMRE